MKLLPILTSLTAVLSVALPGGARKRQSLASRGIHIPRQEPLQDIVSWDEYSLKINGTRVHIFSGEVHPYRMPVASLYLDIFQKIKASGFNTVSFYIMWALHEPKRGSLSFEGFRDLQPFFDAALEAGIYLIARPGPYINAETTGGGFPGWGTYDSALWRTHNTSYVEAYQGYIAAVGATIAKNEITKGGPVILVQSENEYSGFQAPYTEDFEYESRLYQDIREAGITVPITTNDAWAGGHYTTVDIYGYDSYPDGFDCSHPTVTKPNAVPETFWSAHMQISPDVPNAVYEFQGGAFDGWGGAGYESCAVLTGPEFQRVFYKNELAMSTTILNLYMIYGGTSWGGISHPGVYTSYDYGSGLTETRGLREKMYDLKLLTNFVAVSPAFLTTRPQNTNHTQGAFTGNSALKVTQTLDVVGNKTGFYTIRQTDASSFVAQNYYLTLPTSAGELKIPQLGGVLTLTGKDSKIHLVDYDAGSTTLLYSTAELLTWATVDGRDVILLYGGTGELHETAISFTSTAPQVHVVSGDAKGVKTKVVGDNSALAIQYKTTGQTVVEVGNATLYLLDRANAYKFWVLYPPTSGPLAHYSTENPLIIKGGYLLRTAAVQDGTLTLTGDLNATASFEFLTPKNSTKQVTFNGAKLDLKATSYGTLTAKRSVQLPDVTLPSLKDAIWKSADSLPEISGNYSDANWTIANRTNTSNPTKPSTPVVLYSGEYGFHNGAILWRAHITASGKETGFKANVWGGQASGYSVWLDSTFIGSWEGDATHNNLDGTYTFPSKLKSGSTHVITIIADHMGYDEDWVAASETFKAPRGLTSYSFVGGQPSKITWKVQGNLGGEDYVDTARGPLNEGGLYGERQGWHLPGFKDDEWSNSSPLVGFNGAGVHFYRTTFDLDIPDGVDYPIAVAVTNSTVNPHYRAQIFANGYQFGRYLNSIGPQKVFPIPQGILNYNGTNTLAISLWAQEKGGAKLNSLELKLVSKAESSMAKVASQPQPAWTPRPDAV
jgi:beta-galactosidase GanA